MSKGVQIAIGAVAVAALLGWYGYSALGEAGSFRYYQTLEEYLAAATPGPSRVHGYVKPGSIERDVAARVVRFEVQETPPHAGGDAGANLSVVFHSLETPDLFKDGAEVVLEGRLAALPVDAAGAAGAPPTHFAADKVFAKCPSKFEAEAQTQARAPTGP